MFINYRYSQTFAKYMAAYFGYLLKKRVINNTEYSKCILFLEVLANDWLFILFISPYNNHNSRYLLYYDCFSISSSKKYSYFATAMNIIS